MRVTSGLTQEAVAQLMVDRGFRWLQTTVTKTEAGTRPLLLDEFVALCEALDQDPMMTLVIARGPRVAREIRMAELQARVTAAERDATEAEQQAMLRRAQLEQLRATLESVEADQPSEADAS